MSTPPVAASGSAPSGTPRTREFYDRIGWTREGGELVDSRLFTGTEDGPIRQAMWQGRRQRVRAFVQSVAPASPQLAEFGCGASPAMDLARLAAHYTVVDFSATGLAEAEATLRQAGVPTTLLCADICHLPVASEKFDAVYSAHVLYHIDSFKAQAAAFAEILRTVKVGGGAIFVLANPLPLLFPVRLLRRLLASTPIVNTMLNRLRAKPPLPYLPMPLGWMRKQLSGWGDVEIASYAMASVAVEQRVSEYRGTGRLRWKLMSWLENNHPRLATRLGNYVLITVRKARHAP